MMKNLLRVFISLALIAFLFYFMRNDIPQIRHALLHMDRLLCAVSVFVFISTVFIMARRLELIFNVEGAPLSLWEASSLTFIGYFFNNFLPTSVGGDIVKAMCASKTTQEPVRSVTSVLMDRLFGLFTFIMIPSISFIFFLRHIGNPVVPIMIYSFLAVSILCFFMLFNRNLARRFQFIERLLNLLRVGEKVRKIYDGLHNFKNHKAVIVQAMALSILGQSANIFVLYILVLALGVHANVIYFFLLVPIVHLVSMLPSVNGLGIREGAYIYFLGPYIGKEYAAALGLLWLGLLFLMSLIGGVIYFVRHDYHISRSDFGGKQK